MGALNKNVKKELINALDDTDELMFVSEGKLFSLEVHDSDNTNEKAIDLAQEIEEYPELKESLQRYKNNPNMKKYTAKELREQRYEKRK